MLKKIYIKNFILVDEREVVFSEKLNVLSGETGHGKSILLRSILLLFGGQITKKYIRDIKKDTIIRGEFLINKKVYIIERVFSNKKSKIKLNNNEINLQQLKNWSKNIVTSLTQFEKFSFLESEFQLSFIDSFIQDENIIKQYHEEYNKYILAKKDLKKLEDFLDRESDFLSYYESELKELDSLEISTEDSVLEENISKLENLNNSMENYQKLDQLINDEDNGFLNFIHQFNQLLNNSSNTEIKQSFDELKSSLNSFENSLYNVMKESNSAKDDLDSLYERYEEIKPFLKKFKSIDKIIERQSLLTDKIAKISSSADEIDLLNKKIIKIETNLKKYGDSLHKEREKESKKIESKINKELKNLNMKESIFKIKINKKSISENGMTELIFNIKTNKGGEFYPLEEIISGGELSRLMFILSTLKQNSVKLICFDEIDSGIGGQTVINLAQKILKLSNEKQIICITHNPAIAMIADKNIKISKSSSKTSTESFIDTLDEDSILEEISRMLGYGTSSRELNITRDYMKELIHQIKG